MDYGTTVAGVLTLAIFTFLYRDNPVYKVAESAVVGFPHDIKGQGIYAYVTLNANVEKSSELKKELAKHVRKEIGPIATPDVIHWADALPKTRSGKIMRRVLGAISNKKDVGDVTTLANPEIVAEIKKMAETR